MSAKPVFACVTLLALLGGPRLSAQYPSPAPVPSYAPGPGPGPDPAFEPTGIERMPQPGFGPAGPTGLGAAAGPHGLPPGTVTSPWNPEGTPNCCGPIGGHGPIGSELYFGAGVSMPIGGGLLNNHMKTGWELMAGTKTLFFNPDGDRAWVVDLGVSHTYNNARTAAQDQPILFFGVPVTLAGLYRTNFNFSVGRDYWVYTAAYVGGDPGTNIRFGADVGGRWGTAHIDAYELANPTAYVRKQNVTHGVFLGAHVDLECPMGAWTFVTGLRGEWGYTWTNVIPPNDGDIKDVNLLYTIGLRY